VKARSRYIPREFEAALWQVEEGVPIETVCGRLGVARSTFYRWKARFAGDVDLQQWLTNQNQRLHRSVRELAADKAQLQLLLRRGH
jgi:putative transposase